MYKILYNEKQIRLLHTNLESHLKDDQNSLIVHYPGKAKFLLNYLDKLEKNRDLTHLYILGQDVKLLKQDFFSLFRLVPAAGGLILNSKGKVLLIYRRGHWDLPKGKMEEFETKKEAAVREVQEETGLKQVHIIKKLMTSYHIYRGQNSNRRILKPSYWYLMHAKGGKLIPQTEEDIEHVEWTRISLDTIEKLSPIYSNIKDVLKAYVHLVS